MAGDDLKTQDNRSLFEHSPLPMWTFDRETLRFLDVNDAAVRRYGYSRAEFLRMTLADIRPTEDQAALRASVGDGALARTWRHRTKDGSILLVEVDATDLRVSGRDVRFVIVTDVTERERIRDALRRSDEQLRHAQKMEALGRLAGCIAHDFNNVLSVVACNAEFLEEDLAVDDPRRHEATEIRRAANRATALTRQLLVLSRRSTLTLVKLELNDVIADFASMLRRLIGNQIELVVERGEIPSIVADRGHLEQVIMNLAVNARDAMPHGGKLILETAVVELEMHQIAGVVGGTYVSLAVTDTGVGMPEEVRARIFEPFFSTKEAGRGTGLGLSIVHGVVTQAGGAISVYSEPGHGTTFRVYLPVALGSATTVEAEAQPVQSLPSAATVLVVDDDPAVRSVVARVLGEAGCTVLEAATGDDAQRICVTHEGAIDVAIVDVVIADARTDRLVEQLVELRPHLKLITTSGFTRGALGGSRGRGTFLEKPFTRVQLRAAIAGALQPTIEKESSGDATRARPRVLVADDDEILRRTLERYLRRGGFEVTTVTSGNEALVAMRSVTFDAIVSDIHMPGMSGVDLIRAVRRIDLDIPVILVTGAPDLAAAAAAVELGAFRFLTKPLDGEQLVRATQIAVRAHALAKIRRQAFSITSGALAGAADRAGLEVRFESALERLWLAFQPIVEARSGAPVGVEALMRSDEPTMPTPGVILDAATQLRRLPQLGRRVRAAAATLHPHAQPGTLGLFVNLHPDDLLDADLVDESAPLTRLASHVVLEVTERSALASSPELVARLARIRSLGFRIAIDDIGAGFSGLTSFAELQPDIVKIDMGLVRDVHQNAIKQRTIAALCRLCHESDTRVVAEGVESMAERDCLVDLSCDFLQGYVIGRPLRTKVG